MADPALLHRPSYHRYCWRSHECALPATFFDLRSPFNFFRSTVLTIPVYLISTAKLRATQKLALAFSLCLTALLIVFTIIRPTSMRAANDVIDVTWGSFW